MILLLSWIKLKIWFRDLRRTFDPESKIDVALLTIMVYLTFMHLLMASTDDQNPPKVPQTPQGSYEQHRNSKF